jgi:hypothetical protein
MGLAGNLFVFARYSLVTIALGAVLLAALGIPVRYHQLQNIRPAGPLEWDPLRLLPEDVLALGRLGLTPELYAAYFTILETLFFVAFTAIGLLLFSRREQNWMILFSAFTFLLTGAVVTPFLESLVAAQPAWRLPAALLQGMVEGCLLAFFYLLPNGKPFPRWSLLWTAGIAVWTGFTGFLPPGH